MSKPENSAVRNTMTPMERQCYDWGWEDAEERIIKLLEENTYYSELELVLFWNDENGGYSVSLEDLIALIKGEQK